MTSHSRFIFLVLVVSILVLSSCSGGTVVDQSPLPIEPHVGYKPPFLPIQFTVASSGISVSGDTSFVTPIGTFSIGASLPIVESSSRDILLVLRNRPLQTDTVYRISEGQGAHIVLDGHIEIRVTNTTVVIEVLEGQVVEISAPQDTPEEQATAAAATAIAKAPSIPGQPNLLNKVDINPSDDSAHIVQASFSPDGTLLAVLTSATYDGSSLYLWQMPNANLVRTIELGGWATQMRFSPDGQSITTVGDGGPANTWNIADGSLAWTLEDDLGALAFTPDGQWIVAGCRDCYVSTWMKVWRVADRSLDTILTWEADKYHVTSRITMSTDSRWLALLDSSNMPSTGENEIHIIDLSTRQIVKTWENTGGGGDIVMNPNGDWIAMYDQHNVSTISLLRVPDGAFIRSFDVESGLVRSELALSLDGAYLAAADDSATYLWRTADGQKVWKTRELSHDVWFAFSPNGLFATAHGTSIYIWDINQ